MSDNPFGNMLAEGSSENALAKKTMPQSKANKQADLLPEKHGRTGYFFHAARTRHRSTSVQHGKNTLARPANPTRTTIKMNKATMRRLIFLLEEPSAEEMLKGILPRILPDSIHPDCMRHSPDSRMGKNRDTETDDRKE